MSLRVRAALVVPVWNQWYFTRLFLESLGQCGDWEGTRLILVDNGSTDGTAARLKPWSRRLPMQILRNRRNLGCARAWNQGLASAGKLKAAWVGFLNNDLMLSRGWLSALLDRAEKNGLSLASPATREGRLDYDFESYAVEYRRRCAAWDEEGYFGWCFLVKAGVFSRVGRFDESFGFGKGEDEDFVRRLRKNGLKAGITGCSFIHHFGSKTIDALKGQVGESFERENVKRLYARWGDPGKTGPLGRLARAARRMARKAKWGHLLKE
jgi:GT2 family glycosyltransferase